ncbi:MAG: hypothetical protein R2819_10390 [Allomuricauda sp.]
MKRLAVVLVLLTTIGAMAQQQGRRDCPMGMGPKMDMTAEQMASLQTKKLALALDLTQAQQDKVMEISLEEAKLRKERWDEIEAKKQSGEWTRPTPEERFELENERLDRQIAHQQKMKQVLTEEQYDTWKKMRIQKSMYGKKKMQEKGRRG